VTVRRPIHAVFFLATIATWGPAVSSLEAQEAQATDVHLDTGTGTLSGTLLVPANTPPVPVVLIIAGSGPTDRDGNSAMLPGKNNSNRLLAAALASHGIASLRYDKRGIGASAAAMTSEATLRFDTYVDDAAKWVRQLRTDPRFSTITIIGHSEGSLIGMIAARIAGADGYVTIAGPARNAADVLRDQLRPAVPPDLFQQADSILGELEAGRTVASPPPSLASLFRPSVQPYIISWFRYRPATELARLTIPVLIIQGTTDIQVPVDEATALHAATPGAQLVVIDGMNHVLKDVPADQAAHVASYSDSTLALNARLVAAIVGFIGHVAR